MGYNPKSLQNLRPVKKGEASPNKGTHAMKKRKILNERLIRDFLADYEEHGVETIETVRLEKPDVYLKLAMSFAPKEMEVKVSVEDQMSDEELLERIDGLDRLISDARAAIGGSGGSTGGIIEGTAQEVAGEGKSPVPAVTKTS